MALGEASLENAVRVLGSQDVVQSERLGVDPNTLWDIHSADVDAHLTYLLAMAMLKYLVRKARSLHTHALCASCSVFFALFPSPSGNQSISPPSSPHASPGPIIRRASAQAEKGWRRRGPHSGS